MFLAQSRRLSLILSATIAAATCWALVFFADPLPLALAPALVALTAAFVTRRPTLSLLLGALVGALVATRGAPLEASGRFVGNYVLFAVLDGDHLRILCFTLCLGVVARGGARHLARLLRTAVSRPTSVHHQAIRAQLSAWCAGVLLFIDDYLSSMLVGAGSRQIFDRAGVSRAKLAFVVDATAAPVASLAPVSTWIAVELGYIAEYSGRASSQGALTLFIDSIPYRFYPLLMLLFVLVGILLGREYGPMQRATPERPPESPNSTRGVERSETRDAVVEGVLPMALLLLVVALALASAMLRARLEQNLDWSRALAEASSLQALLYGALGGALLALALRWRKSGSWQEVRRLLEEGIGSMLAPCSVLVGAWALSASLQDLATAEKLASAMTGLGGRGLLGALVFFTAALTSFASGTSWGTMAIVFPLALPLASHLDPSSAALELEVIGAVLAGAVFGDHCSPVSDTTVISAAAAGCDTMQHVLTQLPYAVTVGAIALTGHALSGLVAVPPGWVLLFGGALLVLILRVFGEPSVPPG